jgi:hypothetical protein
MIQGIQSALELCLRQEAKTKMNAGSECDGSNRDRDATWASGNATRHVSFVNDGLDGRDRFVDTGEIVTLQWERCGSLAANQLFLVK